MIGRGAKITLWCGAALVVLAGIAIPVILPTSDSGYTDTALSAADEALAQVRTTQFMVDADIDGKMLSPYRAAVVWQARDSLATAQSDFTGEEIPDAAAETVHNELAPLLADAGGEIAAVGAAVDAGRSVETGLSERMRHTGDLLAEFLERHR
ncbi:hypothetical protein SAMN05421837_112281 [Amycolatopsis pretoriensis]|uniref:DUF5667 domain-containing protein n=1 Tax=Amycolatopsis pretoriensis TaxID=218821 RepID=A0A1H5RHI7_9PSEU|nr:hypothetical protein [Amycolatopsis pretoriensis]SEF37168.1 hypothetical protein SAMN05421837_112281 [Amycolatopsis pretoriensis]